MEALNYITEIKDYLSKLNNIKNETLILIAIKDNAGQYLDEAIQEKLYALGLKKNLVNAEMVGYVAVIYEGNVIHEALSEKDGTEEYRGVINGKQIHLVSKPYMSGNNSNIEIDGVDFSLNARGVNIVIFDNSKDDVIDRVAFDTHVPEMDCIHIKNHYDIGIFGWWYNLNYGATLTYYALNRVLCKMGYSVIMLFRGAKNAGMPRTVSIEFAKKHYDISPRTEICDLYRFNNICDTFVLGSDQLWNPDLEKVSGEQFFLSFAETGKRLVAYAQSFGNYDSLPILFKQTYLPLVKRFAAVSVREDFAVNVCKNEFGINAPHVCDPVFLVERTEFERLAEEGNMPLPEHYLLGFILDPTEDKLKFCEEVRERKGIKESIYFTDLDHAEEKAEAFGKLNIYPSAHIENFVRAYRSADFVITDSFHGTCLSIIFERQFLSLSNHQRGARRFESLMRWLGLEKRLLNEIAFSEEILQEVIDYSNVRNRIFSSREESLQWLSESLVKPVPEERKFPTLAGQDCTGCGACFNACPTGSIKMTQDRDGFLKASIDKENCVGCQICEKSCPVLHPKYKNNQTPECIAVMANDETRFISSSGGAFSLFAKAIISKGGMVCGASLTENFSVKHKCVDDYRKIDILRGSKYYQSDIGMCFSEIREVLDANRSVLFTGMPCQVAGLYGFLGKEYENLYTVDLFCHGISSKKVFDKYLLDIHGREKKLTDLKFKAKEPWGWHAGINASFDDGSHYQSPCEKDPFYVAYLNSISKNNTCATCRFNKLPRQGDVTIGDFWGIGAFDKNLNDGKGTSAVLLNSEKGRKLVDMIRDDAKLVCDVPLKYAIAGNHIIEHPYPANRNRELFFHYLDTTDFALLVNGARTNTVYDAYYKTITRNIAPEWLGLYELAKTAVQKANGRKIVTWIRSKIFEEALEKYFNTKVEFGISMRPEACDGNKIKMFDTLRGHNDEYFVVSIDRAYDRESFDKLVAFGYRENVDYIYNRPNPIIIDNYDLGGRKYQDQNGNTIEGYNGRIGHIEFRGRNNHITFGKDIRNPENIKISMHGDSYLTVGDGFFAQDHISFEFLKASWGGARVVIGNNVRMRGGLIRTFSSHPLCEIHVGDKTTFETNPELHANAGKKVVIGRDCMFSHNVDVWAGDGHSIFDVNTGKNTNSVYANQSDTMNALVIGDHTWIAKGAFILHGTNIGKGSIVGAMSVVKGIYPNNCVIAGNPAKKVKNDVAWSRDLVTEDPSRCGWEYFEKTVETTADGNRRKVLILGGTGRMSSKLTELCIEHGDEVTIANRGKHRFKPVAYPVHKLIFDRFNREETEIALQGTSWDVVFDCSGYAPQCVDAVLSLISVKRYIYVSSFETYVHAKCTGLNVKEDDLPVVDMKYEEYTDPKNYGLGKYQSELLIANKYTDLNYAIVRIPFVMSDEDDYEDSASSRIGVYVEAVLKGIPINDRNLDYRYNFVNSHDEAKFLYFLSENTYKGVINFASQGDISMREVIGYTEKITGHKAVLAFDAKIYPFTNHPELTMDLTKCISLGYYPVKISDWLKNDGEETDKISKYVSHYQI